MIFTSNTSSLWAILILKAIKSTLINSKLKYGCYDFTRVEVLVQNDLWKYPSRTFLLLKIPWPKSLMIQTLTSSNFWCVHVLVQKSIIAVCACVFWNTKLPYLYNHMRWFHQQLQSRQFPQLGLWLGTDYSELESEIRLSQHTCSWYRDCMDQRWRKWRKMKYV